MKLTGPPWWPAHEYLSAFSHSGMISDNPLYRQKLCHRNPLVFGLLYFGDTLLSLDNGSIALNDIHCDMGRAAGRWARSLAVSGRVERRAWIGPRGSAKSTWAAVILPLWAMAYQHQTLIALFGKTRKVITDHHFTNIIQAIDGNEMLRHDFPQLCTKLSGARAKTSDTYRSRNGTAIVARGIDEANLGLNINGRRPDLIVIDDPEPMEGNFTLAGKEKMLASIRQGILGMRADATVWWNGTTTAYNCLAHDLVRHAVREHTAQWVRETGFTVSYYPAIISDKYGQERSLWPAVWPLQSLLDQRGIRDFELNMMNRPPSASGTMWQQRHFDYDIPAHWWPGINRRIMWIDPAVTSKATSDYTGIAVASLSGKDRVIIDNAAGIRVTPDGLERQVLAALDYYEDIREVFVEGNNGRDYLVHALPNIPRRAKVIQANTEVSKSVNFARAFKHYERGRVRHSQQFRLCEDQLLGFGGKLDHDDVADAVVNCVNELLRHLPTSATGAPLQATGRR